VNDDAPFGEDRETSSIELDAYGIKGKINPAISQADEPANWWGVLRQLNQLLMSFVVDAPGAVFDSVKGLRNLVRAIGGVKTVPKNLTRIAQAARYEAEQQEAKRGSKTVVGEFDNGADQKLVQALEEMQARGLHVEIVERLDGAIVIIVVRPEFEWLENARRVASYVPLPHEVIVKSLHEIGLSARIIERLEEAGLFSVGDLAALSDEELLRIPGIGRKSLEIIRQCLRSVGS
jgi:hypothetical protein